MTPAEKAAKLAEKIKRQVEKAAGKGLNAARLFLEARVKEEASVKAPTRTSKSGRKYATTRATPGAPLRVVSGRFRQSITSEMVNANTAVIGSNARAPARSGIATLFGVIDDESGGFNYPRWWEQENPVHKTFTPAIERNYFNLAKIVGQFVKAELS